MDLVRSVASQYLTTAASEVFAIKFGL